MPVRKPRNRKIFGTWIKKYQIHSNTCFPRFPIHGTSSEESWNWSPGRFGGHGQKVAIITHRGWEMLLFMYGILMMFRRHESIWVIYRWVIQVAMLDHQFSSFYCPLCSLKSSANGNKQLSGWAWAFRNMRYYPMVITFNLCGYARKCVYHLISICICIYINIYICACEWHILHVRP